MGSDYTILFSDVFKLSRNLSSRVTVFLVSYILHNARRAMFVVSNCRLTGLSLRHIIQNAVCEFYSKGGSPVMVGRHDLSEVAVVELGSGGDRGIGLGEGDVPSSKSGSDRFFSHYCP